MPKVASKAPAGVCGGAEVAEIAGGAAGAVVVVAGDGAGAGFVPAPGRPVAVREVAARPARVRVVTRREHGARDGIEQVRGQRIAVALTVSNVAGPDEYGVGVGCGDLGARSRAA